jgi:hypothetical protein
MIGRISSRFSDLSTPAMMPGSHQTCLLRTALGGTASAETHLVCIDLNKFVTEHGPLLHGPPDRQPRKVVFDQNSEVFHAQYSKHNLAEEFLKAIRLVSSQALTGERIVIVIVMYT